MDVASSWKHFFQNWPADLPTSGVLVVSFGEQIPFESFLVGEAMLLVDRRAPDSIGARKILIPYALVQAVKFTEAVKPRAFAAAGFHAVGGGKHGGEHGPAAPRGH